MGTALLDVKKDNKFGKMKISKSFNINNKPLASFCKFIYDSRFLTSAFSLGKYQVLSTKHRAANR